MSAIATIYMLIPEVKLMYCMVDIASVVVITATALMGETEERSNGRKNSRNVLMNLTLLRMLG